MTDRRRERFEAAMRFRFGWDTNVRFDWRQDNAWLYAERGEWRTNLTDMWIGWQAALDSLDVEAAAAYLVENLPYMEDETHHDNSRANDFAAAILAAAKGER